MKPSRSFAVSLCLVLAAVAVFLLWPRRPSVPVSSAPPPGAKTQASHAPASSVADASQPNAGEALPTAESEPPEIGSWAYETPREPDFVKLQAFDDWLARWKAATPGEREALIAEGEQLAGERREEFKALIAFDPRRALESAVPRVIRQQLPQSIVSQLETPVSSVGDFNVYQGRPAPGMEIPADALTLRYYEADGVSYKARVFGELTGVTSRKGVPLRGVAMDREFAVAENAVRRLEEGEVVPAGTTVQANCPVSGKTTEAVSSGEAVTVETPTVEIGKSVITLCDGSHVTVLEDDFRTYVQASGPGGGGYFMDNYPGTSSRAIGNFRCLYIRVTYPDQMAQPNTEDQAYADMRDNARYYLESSYGKMTQTTTVTSLITLPHTLAWYKAKDGDIDCLGLIHSDSSAEAKKLGYDPSQFDCIIVRVNKGPRLEGISWGGGNRVWITWSGMDVLNHECGHSLGRNHANYWNSSDGTAYGNGSNAEYGNPFDVMGGGGGFSAHYNTISKRALGWLPDGYVNLPKTNGTYRIYAYDQPQLEEGKRYALSVAKDTIRSYNVEYHPARGGLLADSALVLYSGMGSNAGHLLDTTPGSTGGKNDGGIGIGRTYSDWEADMHFTVVSKNATSPPSLDVVYNRGPFPDNQPPVATLAASATTISTGGSVTFTATATDPDGDLLAYHWSFDDGVTGTNTPTFTRAFTSTAQVNALLTVSDMKGGTVRRSVVINVGSHGKQTVTGTVVSGGNPVAGVYISNGTRYCYTNTDGTYTLSGLSTGSTTLTATLAGYTFTPGFGNPMSVGTGTNLGNWTAAAASQVALTKIADAAEGGSSGTFRFTRTGDTSAALTVRISPVGGTAVKGTDYTFAPDFATDGSYRSFTIPAGSSTLDVTVAAVNDTSAEGPETITMQLASNGSYLSTSGNAAVMIVADNDTTLPQVAVTAPDPYAEEAPADPGRFRFTRTGSTASALNLVVAWSGGATNGSDYAALSSTVTIPAGADSVEVAVNPLDDTLIETPEDIVATISTNAAYIRDPGATSATVTLSDDDTPVVNVSVAEGDAREENRKPGVFLVTRSGSTAAPLKVYYGVSGSALHGTDYVWLTGEVMIPAGATSAPVVITPYDDDLGEPTETITLAVTTFNDAYNLGPDFQATMNLLDDNDAPVVAVRAGTVGTEGGSNATVIFRAIGSTPGNITVNYTVGGTATAGSDYTALSGSVSISSNGTNDATVTIPIINDSLPEAAETVVVTISPSASYRVYNDGSAQAVILDNDSGDRVQVSTFNQSPSESGPTVGTYYISRVGTTGDLTVAYAMSGTATNGTDYVSLPGSVVIPAGSLGVDLTLTPINDTIAEGTETATLTILPGTGYGLDRVPSATYEIADNDTAAVTVGFQSGALVMSEQPGPLGEYRDIPVILSAVSATPVTVGYTSAGGSAAGDDNDWAFIDADNGNAVIPGGTLTFPPGTTTKNLRIRIKDDGVAEGSETALLLLRAPNGAGLTAGRSQQSILIYDGSVGNLVTEERWNNTAVYTNNTWNSTNPDYTGFLNSFTPAQNAADNYSRRLSGLIVAPATGVYNFWIASDDASRLYLSTDATAANKVQRASVSGYTSFQAWDSVSSQKSVNINLVAGQSYYLEVQHQEGGGSDHVSVAWQGPGFSRTPIAFSADDPMPRTVRLLTAATTRRESDGGEPQLIAFLDRPAGGTPVTVDYTVGGTATAGSDYTLPAGTLTFAPGEQTKLLPLTLLEDSLNEAPETIVVSLVNANGASISTPSTHTITLIEAAAPVVESRYLTANATMTSGTVLGTLRAVPLAGRTITGWSIVSGNPSNHAFAINAAGQVTLLTPASLPASGTVPLMVRATDQLGAAGDGTVFISCNRLLAWWTLDEGSGATTADRSGNGRNATLTGATWTTARVGTSALNVNGSNQYAQAASLTTTNGFTLSGWIKPATVSGIHTILSQQGSYAFRTTGSTLLLTTPGVTDHTATNVTLATGQWVHVAVSFQPGATGGAKFYVNGVLASAINASALSQTSSPTLIGRTTNWSGQDFNGALDDLRIYNTVLAPEEIADVYGNTASAAPVFSPATLTRTAAAEDAAYSGTLDGAATDADAGDVPFYSKVSGPAWLQVAADGTLSGTPDNGNVGANAFIVKATDRWGLSANATLNISVTNTNDAPVFTLDPIEGNDGTEGTAYAGTLAGTATDVDAGDTLSYSKLTGPSWLNVAANGTLSGTPPAGAVGVNAFTVKVADAAGAFDTTTLEITIIAAAVPLPVVTLSASTPAASEEGPVAGKFTLTRTGDTGSSLIVDLTLGGTATNGTDYVSLAPTATIPMGSASVEVVVTPLADALAEGDETVTLALATSPDYTAGAPSSGVVTIADKPMDGWRLAKFGANANQVSAADSADPDHDGLVNLLEYALGSEPLEGFTAMPKLKPDGTSVLRLDLPDPAPVDLIYTVEGVNRLGDEWQELASKTGAGAWIWLGGGVSKLDVGTPAAGRVTIDVGMPDSAGSPANYFLRLKVQRK